MNATKSKSIVFIVPYPRDKAPSQRFRFEQYISQLERQGFNITFAPFLDSKTWFSLYKSGSVINKTLGVIKSFLRRLILVLTINKFDHVFIHREASHLGPPVFEFIIAKIFRKKYIYDFDDAIWLANYSESNAKFHRLKAYWKVKYCIRWAKVVIVGNDYLATYARRYNDNVNVIPTTIDTENYHNTNTDYSKKIIIGWTGTHTTMRFLDFLVPIVKELETKYDFEFRVISNQKPNYNLKSLNFVKWNQESEIDDLNEISIGVMPLEDEIWAEGKCGFKCLQYMSLGIPSIVSPVGVNKKIVSMNQNGIFAKSKDEWRDALVHLIQNEDARIRLGTAGKETVRLKYSVLAHTTSFLNLFK